MWVSAIVAVVTVASAYGGYISPSRTTLPALASMAFPIMLAISALCLVAGLLANRKAAALTTISLLLCAGPILTFWPMNGNADKSDAEESGFSVMTYNVMQLQDYSDIHAAPADNPTLNEILRIRPDIVALQECSSLRRYAITDLSRNQLDTLHRVYPYRAVGAEGQSILSRFPFKEITLDPLPSPDFQVRAYDIETPGGNIILFNLHLKSIGLTDNDKSLYRNLTDGRAVKGQIREELDEFRHDVVSKLSAAFRIRAQQAETVRQLIDSIGGRVIVCGDFNDTPGSYACRTVLGDDLSDAYRNAASGPAITYHASRFYFRIDHIFNSDHLKAANVEVIKLPTSDHYPVMAHFTAAEGK